MSTVATRAKGRRRRTSKKDRDALILRHMPLVKTALNRVAAHLPAHVDRDDLLEAGMVGLVSAAERYEASRNVKFSTYAMSRVRGAMLDALRDADWLPRSTRNDVGRMEAERVRLEHERGGPVSDDDLAHSLKMARRKLNRLTRSASRAAFASLDELPHGVFDEEQNVLHVAPDTRTDPEQRTMLEEEKQRLIRAIPLLPARERLVISLYYFEGLLLGEIAEILHVTTSRVCQIHRRALSRLQGLLTPVETATIPA